jgi:O-antigen ligase
MHSKGRNSIGRCLLLLTLVLAPFQIYTFALGDTYLPLVLLLSLGLAGFYDVRAPLKTSAALKWLIALLVAQAISLAWAVSVRDGIRDMVYTLAFVFVFVACMQESKRNPGFVIKLIIAYTVLALVQSGLVVLFRLDPGVKLSYLQSRLATVFANPTALNGLFDAMRNNVLDPTKSGGFELNANSGGAWVGLVGLLALGLAVGLRRRLLLCVAALHLCAVAFTGSKASLMLAVGLTICLVILVNVSKRVSASRLAVLCFVLAVLLAVGALGSVFLASTQFGQDSSDTIGSREVIWAHAAMEFANSPVLGQGYGGWTASFKPYAWRQRILEQLPPHDTFIQLWSQSGLPAVVCAIGFVTAFIVEMLQFTRCGSKTAAWVGAGMLCGFLFIFLQGLGENWGLLGTLRVSPLLAACLAVARVLSFRIRAATENESRKPPRAVKRVGHA